MPNEPRLRGNARRRSGAYPLGEIQRSTVVEIGGQIVYRLAVGDVDITGDDFGAIFAKSIGGEHRGSPLGIADVSWNDCAWSVKTVKGGKPFRQPRVRVISGRNSPSYSYGITDPNADIQATGAAVLNIWNARVNESLTEHNDLRIITLIRNMKTLEFTLFESEATRFVPSHYRWEVNTKGNFEAYDRSTNAHSFTWQPHGSQFTVIHHVPASACSFRITHKPDALQQDDILNLIEYDDSWIQAVQRQQDDDGQIH